MIELTEQERKLEKSTAEAHGSLSLGLFATAVFTCSIVDGSWWIPLVVIGALLALSSIYLAFIHRWKRKKFLEIAASVRLEHVAWFLGFVALGISLLQTGCVILILIGEICIGIAYAILILGVMRVIIEAIRERRRTQKAKVV